MEERSSIETLLFSSGEEWNVSLHGNGQKYVDFI